MTRAEVLDTLAAVEHLLNPSDGRITAVERTIIAADGRVIRTIRRSCLLHPRPAHRGPHATQRSRSYED